MLAQYEVHAIRGRVTEAARSQAGAVGYWCGPASEAPREWLLLAEDDLLHIDGEEDTLITLLVTKRYDNLEDM